MIVSVHDYLSLCSIKELLCKKINKISLNVVGFYRAMHYSAKRSLAIPTKYTQCILNTYFKYLSFKYFTTLQ